MNNLTIKKIEIKVFRNLQNISFDFSKSKNYIYGKNGTGKSTVLDAIRYVLLTKDETIHQWKIKIL